ncbi:MAG: YggS family pyridoxal phosphate-dependent enzyme [Peptococcaceae bacterium]|nr:YggS family pyridoxal phosphate-dependent enzyme [Peptococcaceae bacterium]
MERSGIKENLAVLRGNVLAAAVKAGRNPADIKIVAVSKNVPVDRMLTAVEEGVTDLGENRVQELLSKQPHFGSGVRWHLIGHLQTNKVKAVVGRVELIHSLDSWRLAVEIDRRSGEAGVVSEVLVQVNASGEKTKYGLNPVEVPDFIAGTRELPGLAVRGLMTIAPLVDDPEEVRPVFRCVRDLFFDIKQRMPFVSMTYLSMGMTDDYLVAVEEGANILRVGTGIFGAR